MSSPRVVAELLSVPVMSVADAKLAGSVPSEPGYYAWWCELDALPRVPIVAHPCEPLGLLYVGIAPRDASS